MHKRAYERSGQGGQNVGKHDNVNADGRSG